jgi:acyl-CoA thioesterase FadM
MARIKIKKQNDYPFKTELIIRVSDLNYGGHLGYDKVLSLAHQARLELFKQWGVTELDLGDGKTGMVASDAGVNYLGEGFLHDSISIGIKTLELTTITFRLAYSFVNISTQKEIARLETGFVAFNYKLRSTGKIPESFAEKLNTIAG